MPNAGEITMLNAFLTNRTQQVILNGVISQPCPVLSGVPQGSVMGPLLFLCYINDMPTVVTSKIKDDALLYRSIHSDQDINTLQDDLDALSHWATTWQMKFNPNKCEHLRISNKLNLITSRYYINKTLIREVPHAKYLGVTIDQKLTWHKHINNIVNKLKATWFMGFYNEI